MMWNERLFLLYIYISDRYVGSKINEGSCKEKKIGAGRVVKR